jgi:nitrate reductase gamma subunit
MSTTALWGGIVLIALALCGVGLGWRLRRLLAHPSRPDRAPPRGAAWRGILYAFTWGMMPWAKESTRRHFLPYVRGVLFHIGIFATFASLIVSPWRHALPPTLAQVGLGLTLMGALGGLIGVLMRILDERLRALSHPDDDAAVVLVTAWQAAGTAFWADPGALPFFYGLSALTLVAIPLTKIRHCLYFFFSRFFFGRFYGRRAVLG